MEVRFLESGGAQAVLVELARTCDSREWAVAWAQPKSDVLDAAFAHKKKFTRLVIGTHFHQTDPGVLRKFLNVGFARMMLPTGDTFHRNRPTQAIIDTGATIPQSLISSSRS